MKTPHLDNKHVVFGQVTSGKSIIRQIENLPTQSGDKPAKDVVIADCGELPADAAVSEASRTADPYGDVYEDFPEDETDEQPLGAQKCIQVASDCKDFGNKAFKAGDVSVALDKYQKGLRYLNEDPDLEKEPADTKQKMDALRAALNSNAALMNNKLEAWDEAVRAATNALDVGVLSDKDKAKALYRRGFAYVRLKDEEAAVKDLEEAKKVAPEDKAVIAELASVKKAAAERLAKEKKAYKKFFV